jgi:hypothetical protein
MKKYTENDFYCQLYVYFNRDKFFNGFVNKNINNNLKGKLYSEFRDIVSNCY